MVSLNRDGIHKTCVPLFSPQYHNFNFEALRQGRSTLGACRLHMRQLSHMSAYAFVSFYPWICLNWIGVLYRVRVLQSLAVEDR